MDCGVACLISHHPVGVNLCVSSRWSRCSRPPRYRGFSLLEWAGARREPAEGFAACAGLATVSLVATYGVLKRRRWSRWLAIAVCVVGPCIALLAFVRDVHSAAH